MVKLSISGRVVPAHASVGIGIRALQAVETASGPVVLAVSGATGGLMSVGFTGSGQAELRDVAPHTPALGAAVDGTVSVIQTTLGQRVLVGRFGTDQRVGFTLEDTGHIGARADLWGPGLASPSAAGLQQVGEDYVFVADAFGTLRCFALISEDQLSEGPRVQDTAETFHASPLALTQVRVDGRLFLLTACGEDTGVSLFEIDPNTGRISHRDALSPALGLGLYKSPVALESLTVAGQTYVVIASAPATGQGAGLSVVRLDPGGTMTVTDHILDGQHSRFGNVTGLDVVVLNGQAYVAAAGGDQGISLFALIPGGRLVHLQSITATTQTALQSLSDIALVAEGERLHILAADQSDIGLVHLSAQLSPGIARMASAAGEQFGGGEGDDMLSGGRGADRIWGGSGSDILFDGAGRDTLIGGPGADRFVLEADGVEDVIEGFDASLDRLDLSLIPFLYSPEALTVTTTARGAQLVFRDEVLTLLSASGGPLGAAQVLDTILWETDRPPLILRPSVKGGAEADTLVGSEGADLISGGAGDDVVYGRGGDDDLSGGEGRDTLFGGDGVDIIRGGVGRDEIHLGAGDDVFEDAAEGGVTGRDTVFGGSGHDTIRARGGDDVVWGGNGQDWVTLGAGHDLFHDNGQAGPLGQDTVFGGAGNDTVQGGNGDDAFYGGWGNDVLIGRLGNDRLFGGAGLDSLYAGDGADRVWSGDGPDLVFLGRGPDVFVDSPQEGALGRDTVFAGEGDDRIEAFGGNDEIHGEAGNDVLFGGTGHDRIFGGMNFDTIYAAQGADTVFGGLGRDTVFLGPGRDLFNDTAQGGALGRDLVYGGDGNDTIEGAGGDDRFFGGAGDDVIRAGKGNDSVYGGAGNDTLEAGEGNDSLWGGPGRDTFIFRKSHGRDDLYGLEAGKDQVLLDPALWDGGLSVAQVLSTYGSVSHDSFVLNFGLDEIRLHGYNAVTELSDTFGVL